MKVLLIVTVVLALVLLTSAGGGGHGRKCSRVSKPENGSIRGSRQIGRGYKFSCQKRYWLQGSIRNITCQNIRGQPTWSSDQRPICVLPSKFLLIKNLRFFII